MAGGKQKKKSVKSSDSSKGISIIPKDFSDSLSRIFKSYNKDISEIQTASTTKTDFKYDLRIIDAYILLGISTACILVVYRILFGDFPFNSFLAALFGCLGTSFLAVGLRLQLNPLDDKTDSMKERSPQRVFVDFLFANLILFLVVMNFMG